MVLLASAEGAPVHRRTVPWLPAAATAGSRAVSLWSLSTEALDDLATAAAAAAPTTTAQSAPQAGAQAAKEVAPSERGLTCVTCGVASFASRDEQAQHFASEDHRTRAKLRSEGDADDACETEDVDDEEEDEESPVSDYEPCGLRRDERSSTLEVSVGAGSAVSVSPALLGAASFFGGRAAAAITGRDAADRLTALARLGRPPRTAVLALRSGRFAGAVFDGKRLTHHRVLTRYTTRRGQGGAQATVDSSGHAPKSMGAQLRRHGEQALSSDVRRIVGSEWRAALDACDFIVVSTARVLRPILFHGTDNDPAPLDPASVQRLPFAVPRPTLDAVKQAHDRLGTLVIHPVTPEHSAAVEVVADVPVVAPRTTRPEPAASLQPAPEFPQVSPASQQLLEAAARPGADPEAEIPDDADVDARDFVGRRPLHLAAAAGNARFVLTLLDRGADPTAFDERERVPYLLAADKKTREAFRIARAQLGEDAFDWVLAAVPEPLDDAARAAKHARQVDKKKRQRDKQKAAKQRASQQAALRADAEAAREAARAARQALDAERFKCDHCHGPIRSTPFTRLDYQYCSAACAANHRRVQCAEAAERRMRGL